LRSRPAVHGIRRGLGRGRGPLAYGGGTGARQSDAAPAESAGARPVHNR